MGVTNEGINHILDTEFASGEQVHQWYLGLIHGGGTPVLRATDTLALHPGWFETHIERGQGDMALRKPWKVTTASAEEVGNAREVLFTNGIAKDFPVYGLFLTSARPDFSTGGVLFATLALAGGVKLMGLYESLTVNLTLSLS